MVETVTEESALVFFLEALDRALAVQRITVSADAHMYVAGVLRKQMAHGWSPSETISDRLVKALQEEGGVQRIMLQEVGEMALVFSGLWWRYEYRPRRPSNIQLYLSVGTTAYANLKDEPFSEVGKKFPGLVDALIRIFTESSLKTDRDRLKQYALYQETKSQAAAHMLASRGIVIIESENKIPS